MKELEQDSKLKPIIEEHGELELEHSEDPFRRLVISIINQQLSTESAASIKQKVFDNFEITPESLIDADERELSECGLSGQKIEYISSAAEQFLEDNLSSDSFADMTDKEVVEELTDIHGVGVWTAKMFLITVLAREDVFPVEDLGIRRAMEEVYGIEERSAMKEKAQDWKPYRSYASLYLWKSKD